MSGRAKAVKAIEHGGPCAGGSVDRLVRALDVRGDFRTPGWTNVFDVPVFDFDDSGPIELSAAMARATAD